METSILDVDSLMIQLGALAMANIFDSHNSLMTKLKFQVLSQQA